MNFEVGQKVKTRNGKIRTIKEIIKIPIKRYQEDYPIRLSNRVCVDLKGRYMRGCESIHDVLEIVEEDIK